MPTPRPGGAPRPRDGSPEGAAGAEPSLTGFPDLLAATECRSAADLDQRLYAAFDLDPRVSEVEPGHVVVTIRERGVEVPFPCSPRDFWEAVTLLENDVRRRLEDADGG